MWAVIMAGGEGTRLKPFTEIIPKPLLPIGDKPILEVLIRQLKNEGFERLIITTGYKGDLIKAFFQDGVKYGVNIEYTDEPFKMGTAGALSLIRTKPTESFLIINGDILTDLNLRNFMAVHKQEGAIFTIGIVKYKLDIPYGVVKTTGNIFESIDEKPRYFFDIGAGIYGASPKIFQYIPIEQPLDVPDLIKTLKARSEKVQCHEIAEYWKDIGIIEDYETVRRDIASWDQDRLYHRNPFRIVNPEKGSKEN